MDRLMHLTRNALLFLVGLSGSDIFMARSALTVFRIRQ
jgi:hypothetical protein